MAKLIRVWNRLSTGLVVMAALCSALITQPGRVTFAAPANPEPIELTQPNGTPVQAFAIGDEYQNSIVTGEGYTILQNKAGFWTYATLNASGHLIAGDRRVGLDVPPPVALNLRAVRDERIQSADATAQQHYTAIGTQPILVLLVQFTDQLPIGTTPASWQQTFFNPTDSVAAYYREVSQGLLQLVPAADTSGVPNDGIVGWLTLPYPHPNTNTIGQTVRRIAQDAAIAADPFVNYASFDTDGNGYISSSELHIVVVFAGYEGSYSPINKCGNSVWGHRANMADLTTVDNVIILNSAGDGGYAGLGEWHCTSTNPPGHPATIGPIIHEIGHDLGLPDLYDIDNTTYGAGTWSPMALGAWNAAPGRMLGQSPAHHDAFSRTYLGWITPTLITSSQADLVLPPVELTGQALQFISNPNDVDWEFRYHSGEGEYYLVENRQRIGYDAGLPGCGLLIWHVDESAPFSNSANANDESRLLSLQQADGLDHLDRHINTGDSSDPFPGTSGSNSFGRFTKPSSVLYSGTFSGITLTKILAANADCPTMRISAGQTDVQASTASNTTLNSEVTLSTSALDFSIHMKAELEGKGIAEVPDPTPTPVPTPSQLSQSIYLPLLWR